MLRKGVLAGTALLLGGMAHADPGFYAGVSGYVVERQENDLPDLRIPRLRPLAIGVSGGYRFNRHLAIEARALTARSKQDSLTVAGQDARLDYDLEYAASGLLKGILPIGRTDVNAYAVLGATVSREKGAIPGAGIAFTDTNTDLSYGAGFEMWATSTWGAQLEYIRLRDSSSVTIDAVSLGFLFRF